MNTKEELSDVKNEFAFELVEELISAAYDAGVVGADMQDGRSSDKDLERADDNLNNAAEKLYKYLGWVSEKRVSTKDEDKLQMDIQECIDHAKTKTEQS